jgi:hypothetical protein
VQGQEHSHTALRLRCFLWVVTGVRQQLSGGKVPMLPTDATKIVEVCPWYNTVVRPNLTLAP